MYVTIGGPQTSVYHCTTITVVAVTHMMAEHYIYMKQKFVERSDVCRDAPGRLLGDSFRRSRMGGLYWYGTRTAGGEKEAGPAQRVEE